MITSDSQRQLHVLGQDGHSLGVETAKMRVLKKPHQVRLTGFLERQDGRALETQVGLELLGDLAHQALEGQFLHQQLGAALVLADLAQRHRAQAVSLLLLLRSCGLGHRQLAGVLSGNLAGARHLATVGLVRSLFRASHLS